ncbi:MAG TPA: hypothetical protein VH592_11470 [Gemmataceae bacterium]
MKRFRLATSATLVGVMLAAGCASPCGDCCRPSLFQRMSMFRPRRHCCPAECCSSCGGGGCGGGYGGAAFGAGPEWGDGPILEPPGSPYGGPPMGGMPPSMLPPPAGAGTPAPGPFPPSLGAPLGTPAIPTDPGRLSPIPNGVGAQPFEAGPSSRIGRR